MKLSNYLLLIFCACSAHSASHLAAAESCSAKGLKEEVSTTLATAGVFANLRGAESSIKVQAQRILDQAKTAALGKDDAACQGCKLSDQPRIIFRAEPNQLLGEYDDQAKCEEYLRRTTASPIKFTGWVFRQTEEFAEMFSRFAQGKGDDGKLLYEKCDGDCSPRYTVEIVERSGGISHADINVICGPARDKDEGNYKLSSAVLWRCSEG